MKLHLTVFAVAIFLVTGCERSSKTVAENELYFHWFALGEKQEFVPLQTSEVRLGYEFDAEGLKGKVLRDSTGIHATLEGSYGLSVGEFRNYVELDEIFGPTLYSYSGVIHETFFVVSSNPNTKPFYKKLMEWSPSDTESFEIDLNLPLFRDPEPEA